MRLPTPLLRNDPDAYKNQFGHVLILAGSRRMLGACALTGLAAMRCGAGLTTLGVPRSLNGVLQKKISPVLMTWPLPETPNQSLSSRAWSQLSKAFPHYQAIAIGPGLGVETATRRLVHSLVRQSPVPLVIDADALNALSGCPELLIQTKTAKILTPHPGEFSRLSGISKKILAAMNPEQLKQTAGQWARDHHCTLILKGHRTLVVSANGTVYQNTTGNAGMATAGSGDVLTGMIGALLAQGVDAFEAAKFAVWAHGRSGDLAAKITGKAALIATDIIEAIPTTLRRKP